MWTTDNDHAAQLQFHTGRHVFEGFHPTIGSWVHYGLGRSRDNLPQFVVLGNPPGDCCGGVGGARRELPRARSTPACRSPSTRRTRCRSARPGNTVTKEGRAKQLDLLRELNGLAGVEYPDDPAMRARMKAYELAAKMQLAVPEVMDLVEGDRPRRRSSTASTTRRPPPTAGSASSRGGWPSAACASSRSTTAAAAAAAGTHTAS